MQNPYATHSVFPPVGHTERRGHIPIRSITYKKTLDNKDVELKKEMLNTMGKFPSSPFGSPQQTSPTRASTNAGMRLELAGYKPYMACTFHKLSLGSTKYSSKKDGSPMLPNLKTPKLEKKSTMNNYSIDRFEARRAKMAEGVRKASPQSDYFKLLFDEKRQTFSVEECEGVDEYYTSEMIMSRIHSQGFRDPKYYSTRIERVEMQVPDEDTIREDYRFKVPPVVSTMENDNVLATHLLGGTWNNIKFVESNLENELHQLEVIKAEKKQVESDIETIKKKFEEELRQIQAGFGKQLEQLQTIIKEDFVANQNENFKAQKEITLLQRDKLNIEKAIEECVPCLQKLDGVLYGREIFNLESNQVDLGTISTMNLRPELHMSMRNSQFIH